MNNGSPRGIDVGVGNIDVLKDTDIGLLRNKKGYDKSTYTKETKPDGTVVETVKMNKKNSSNGIIDLQTQGVNLGNRAADVGISERSTEDTVGFVDSIWGSRQAAGKIQDKRLEEAKLENFKKQRELQMQEDSKVRALAAEQQMQEEQSLSGRTI